MASRTEARCPCETDFKHFGNINGRFYCKTYHFLCHCEAAARPWQSLSLRHGIPWRSTGARNKKKFLSQKTGDLLHRSASSLFIYGSVSFRATIVRSGMTNRSVKDCRVGRKNCALLAMTNLVGFAEKRNKFRNETFENGTISGTKRLKNDTEQYRAKNDRIKQKTSVFQIKTPQFRVIARSAATWQS